jgi:hypothetical protein
MATLQCLTGCLLVRSQTSIRVPKVFAWDSNPANPVGAEYIVMEKVAGVPLSEKWRCISNLQRYKLIERVVDVEKELARIRFPAYGSLYLRDSLGKDSPRCLLNSSLDPSESFCIGPLCERSGWAGPRCLDITGRELESGPCESMHWPCINAAASRG